MTQRRAGPAGSQWQLGKAGQPGEPVGPQGPVTSYLVTPSAAPKGQGMPASSAPPENPILQILPGAQLLPLHGEDETKKQGGHHQVSLCLLRDGHRSGYWVTTLPMKGNKGKGEDKTEPGPNSPLQRSQQ